MSTSETILVAGSTGYVGRYIVQELATRGYSVRALTRSEERLGEIGPFGAPAVRQACAEVAVAEVTRPEVLPGAFDGVDAVISSVGISRQRDGLTFDQVDHLANKNLIEAATAAGVRKFVYVSLWDPNVVAHLEIVRAHEKVVAALESSGLEHTIVRPSGYFSDMGALLDMARRGRSFVIGDGTNCMNPIHGADVGRVCADALDSPERELGAGGPDIYTQREAAELAFEVLGREPKITAVPIWLCNLLARGIGLLSTQFGDLAEFLVTAGQVSAVAPQVGRISLREYFEQLLTDEKK
ncbi:MAG: SDR family oxidoreductase [Candidatus Binatia bacterium]|nr:SDR family oxidoreductase [Candidatus Binatia bacterium]